jgi:hypothetical protein
VGRSPIAINVIILEKLLEYEDGIYTQRTFILPMLAGASRGKRWLNNIATLSKLLHTS